MMQIVVAGRGGTGKTVIAAGLINLLGERGTVWGIDADPDGSLPWWLGFRDEVADGLKPFSKYTLNGVEIDDLRERFTLEDASLRLLRMGAVKQAGSGCYCRENAFLRAVLRDILAPSGETVVVDLAAGVEQLSRGAVRGVDAVVVVTMPRPWALRSSLRLVKMARELGVPKVGIVANQVRDDNDLVYVNNELSQDLLWGIIRWRDALRAEGERGQRNCEGLPAAFQDDLALVLGRMVLA